jgi:hypothetical protein
MQIEIKDLKRGMIVILKDDDPDDYYKVYEDARLVDGVWHAETTSSGDYIVDLIEGVHEISGLRRILK